MWALKNRTPYAAERTWLRDKDGRHLWMVVVKATFQIEAGGTVRLADQQMPVCMVAEHFGDPGASSLRYEADLVLPKPTTDVLLEGSAHAPNGVPVSAVPVRVRVGDLRKDLVAYGPRTYILRDSRIGTSDPERFVEMPIVYEWALGGTDAQSPDPSKHACDPRNPIGKGFALDLRRLVDSPAHRIEYVRGNQAPDRPAGLGPIASHWSPRRQHAGTYDEAWRSSRLPLLPADYVERFVQSAPVDQQAPTHLRGGEPVELVNLTPNGVLRFDLPRVYPAFRTRVRTQRYEHRAKLSTVLFLPDAMSVVLVWQAPLTIEQRDVEYVEETVVYEKRYLQ